MRANDEHVVAVDVTLLAGEVGANRSPVVLAAPAFQMPQEIELHVARLKHVVAGQRRRLAHVQRMHQHGRYQDDQLLLAGGHVVVPAGSPDDRQIAPQRHAIRCAAEVVLDQTGHGERLAFAEFDGGVELALGNLTGHLAPLTWVVATLGVDTLAFSCRRIRSRSVI